MLGSELLLHTISILSMKVSTLLLMDILSDLPGSYLA